MPERHFKRRACIDRVEFINVKIEIELRERTTFSIIGLFLQKGLSTHSFLRFVIASLQRNLLGTPLLYKFFRAWTSGPLWTATTTSMATLACVPDNTFLLV